MNALDKKDKEVIFRVILNTKKKKGKSRPNNLYEIAQDILFLKNKLGNIKSISKLIEISPNMLNRFLSVLNVTPELIPSIQRREIDNINAMYYIQKLSSQDQIKIGNLLKEGKINSTDIRAITPLRKKNPHISLEKLLSKVEKSKPIKNYIILFQNKNNIPLFNKKLTEIINKENFKIINDTSNNKIII